MTGYHGKASIGFRSANPLYVITILYSRLFALSPVV